jgi:K+-sensing histidine kinase KdpD
MRNLARLIWFNRAPFLSHVVAALGVAVAVIAALLLERNLLSSPIVLLFLCAIMFAAWFGGGGAGLTAAALSILAFDYFFLPPV